MTHYDRLIFRNKPETPENIKEFEENLHLKSLMMSVRWKLYQLSSSNAKNRLNGRILEVFLSYIEEHPECIEIWTEQLYWNGVLKGLSGITMRNLKILNLRNNEILSCEPLISADFLRLKKLDLSNNLIINFSPLIRMRPLQECYLQNNPCFVTSFIGRINNFEKVRLPVKCLNRIKQQYQSIGYLNFIAKKEREIKRLKGFKETLSLVTVGEELEEESDDFSMAVISPGPYAQIQTVPYDISWGEHVPLHPKLFVISKIRPFHFFGVRNQKPRMTVAELDSLFSSNSTSIPSRKRAPEEEESSPAKKKRFYPVGMIEIYEKN